MAYWQRHEVAREAKGKASWNERRTHAANYTGISRSSLTSLKKMLGRAGRYEYGGIGGGGTVLFSSLVSKVTVQGLWFSPV